MVQGEVNGIFFRQATQSHHHKPRVLHDAQESQTELYYDQFGGNNSLALSQDRRDPFLLQLVKLSYMPPLLSAMPKNQHIRARITTQNSHTHNCLNNSIIEI